MIFQTALQTQSQYLQMLHALARNANETATAAWRNNEHFQRRHAELVRDLMQAQGKLAAEQWAQAMVLWQGSFRTYQEAQAETLTASQVSASVEAEDAADISRHLAQAAASARNGKERRTALVTAYPGTERRKAVQHPDR